LKIDVVVVVVELVLEGGTPPFISKDEVTRKVAESVTTLFQS
jgi:hypothetical protein